MKKYILSFLASVFVLALLLQIVRADSSPFGSGIFASGTSALGTSAIGAGACATTVTTSASGVASTDAIAWSHNAAVTAGTNGSLIVHAFPTANNVNFQECNPTAVSITPPADALNWRVVR